MSQDESSQATNSLSSTLFWRTLKTLTRKFVWGCFLSGKPLKTAQLSRRPTLTLLSTRPRGFDRPVPPARFSGCWSRRSSRGHPHPKQPLTLAPRTNRARARLRLARRCGSTPKHKCRSSSLAASTVQGARAEETKRKRVRAADRCLHVVSFLPRVPVFFRFLPRVSFRAEATSGEAQKSGAAPKREGERNKETTCRVLFSSVGIFSPISAVRPGCWRPRRSRRKLSYSAWMRERRRQCRWLDSEIAAAAATASVVQRMQCRRPAYRAARRL